MSKLTLGLKRGIIEENPTFVQVLGMCPTLATTTSAINGLGMGLSVTAVLIGSNLVISALRKIIPNKIRIPAYIIIIATIVSALCTMHPTSAGSPPEGTSLPKTASINCFSPP